MDNTPAPIKIFDLNKLTLWTPSPVVPNRNAQMRWGIRDGNPRITVFTGEPQESNGNNNFPLTAAMDPITFYTFIDLFRTLLLAGKPDSMKLKCKGRRYENGQPTKDQVLRSTLYFGINDEGFAWISVRVEGKPEIVFKYTLSNWHEFFHRDGNQVSQQEMSIRLALSALKLAEKLFIPFIGEAVRNPVNYKERASQWDAAKGNNTPSPAKTAPSEPAKAESKEKDNDFSDLFEDIPL